MPQIEAATARGELPPYAARMAAFHRACARELRDVIGVLPIRPGDRVLDLACGDGTYSVWLAERVGDSGSVVGVDISERFLDLARRHARGSAVADRIRLCQGDVRRLPFDAGEFDAVWCAHSLYSLPGPNQALAEMRRVVRPGGIVGVLENDSLHYLLMPWPPDTELAVHEAQLAALRAGGSRSPERKLYIGRRLRGALARAGLIECRVQTFAIDHQAPLDPDERAFLEGYLAELAERTHPFVEPETRESFERLLDPSSPRYLLDQPDFFTTHLEILAWGSEPR